MDFKIDFDANDVGRKLRDHAERIANEHLGTMAQKLQEACDAVHDRNAGDAVEVVYEALEAELATRSLELPYDNVRAYADAIAQGRRVRVEFKPVRM